MGHRGLWLLAAALLLEQAYSQIFGIPPAPIVPTVPIVNIYWDVVLTPSEREYHVVIRIENNQPLTPIPTVPGWALTWTWQQDEFIWTADNANVSHFKSNCTGIPAAPSWALDFSTVASCDSNPVVSDNSVRRLPGSLSASLLDPGNNTAQFYLRVGKSAEYFGTKVQILPTNFTLSQPPGYSCLLKEAQRGRRLPQFLGASATYLSLQAADITCSLTQEFIKTPPCCVAFSGFFFRGVVSCPSCSCGCPDSLSGNSTSGNLTTPSCIGRGNSGPTPASQILLQPPPQIPTGICSSGCGVSIHIDFPVETTEGWTLRVAIANGNSTGVQPWALLMDMPLLAYLAQTYTVNYMPYQGTLGAWYGKPYFNDLLQPLLGSVAWEIQFSKKSPVAGAPAVASVTFGALPTAVTFMGQRCAMPNITLVQLAVASGAGQRRGGISFASTASVAAWVAIILLML